MNFLKFIGCMIILGAWTTGIVIVHGMGGLAADSLYIFISTVMMGSWGKFMT